MFPTITSVNIQAFFSTARTKEEAARYFGFNLDSAEKQNRRLAARFQHLFFNLHKKQIFRELENKQFLTVKGEYVGYNQRVAQEVGSS